MPLAGIAPPKRDHRIHIVRMALREEGYIEVLPLSLVSAALLTQCALDPAGAPEIENPLGEDSRLLRTSTLPGLLAHAQRSLLHAGETLQTFEAGHVFARGAPEHLELGMLLASRTETNLRCDPFLLLKDQLTAVLRPLGFQPHMAPSSHAPSSAHPGRSADIAAGDAVIGQLFEVHPAVRERFDLPHRAAAALIDLSRLFALQGETHLARPLPSFPSVTYDVTVTADARVRCADLLAKARASSPLLWEIVVADLYEGAPLAPHRYTITFRCTYRAADRTLTDEEAKREHERVIAAFGMPVAG
jgi:phenylalanyl-tRNA synthetase beta chain